MSISRSQVRFAHHAKKKHRLCDVEMSLNHCQWPFTFFYFVVRGYDRVILLSEPPFADFAAGLAYQRPKGGYFRSDSHSH
jgi:hypothetical protein